MNNIRPYNALVLMSFVLLSLPTWSAQDPTASVAAPISAAHLTLEQAIRHAWETDPWLKGSEAQQKATMAQGLASGALPDPTLSFGLVNFPVDSFDMQQEPMTQTQVALRQVFPRGKSRALTQQQFAEMSQQQPYLRDDRRRKLAMNISRLWLDALREREKIHLIKQDRRLFEHLIDVAQSAYSSARGGTRQQDVIRAQLELTRLEDSLHQLSQGYETARAALEQWLQVGDGGLDNHWQLAPGLPKITAPQRSWLDLSDRAALEALLSAHPVVIGMDQRIRASKTGIAVARQAYKPQWGLNLSYGHREDDSAGRDRADFLSLGVSVEMPIFGRTKQDKNLEAAVASTEVLRTERALLLRQLKAHFEALRLSLRRLDQREALYKTRLIFETHEQAEAAFNAYASDQGSFSEVVRARIAEINAKKELWDISVDRQQVLADFIYFFPQHSPAKWPSPSGEMK